MANGDNLIVGRSNSATLTTRLSRSGEPAGRFGILVTSALEVTDDNVDGIDVYTPQGYGVSGLSDNSTGVYGESDQGNGAEGYSLKGRGAVGTSEQSTGVVGVSFAEKGAYGESLKAHDSLDWMDANFDYGSVNEIGVHGVNHQGSANTHGVYGGGGWAGVSANGQLNGIVTWNSVNTNIAAYLATQLTNGEYLAADFYGNVRINGKLSKSGGGFLIDHPLDPANKYLQHSFVESPDMKNMYDGVATLNARGEAIVKLPSWFGALNKNFRYQLTAIGSSAPALHIAKELSRSRFKIAGGKGGLKISWQVTGIRQDPWANAHRIPVKEKKPAKERGLYLHPDLHKQPDKKNVKWVRHPKQMVRCRPNTLMPKRSATTIELRQKPLKPEEILRRLSIQRKKRRFAGREKKVEGISDRGINRARS